MKVCDIVPQFKNPIIDGMKKCNICEETKLISEFYIYKGHPRGHCKKCNYEMCKKSREKQSKEKRSEYWKKSWENLEYRKRKYASMKQRMLKIKEKSVDYLGGKCSKCGYDKCIEALEFHHIDPSIKEKHKSGRGIDRRKSFEANKSELDKCILLCANCHREEHFNEE